MTTTQIATVEFHGQPIAVITGPNGEHLVAMKPICENIGLEWHAQRQRIKRHPVLSEGAVIITAPSKSGDQEYTCLPLDYLNGWLFGVDSTRVKPEVRPRLIQYQRECFQVLAAYFQQGQAVNPRKTKQPKTLPKGLNSEQQAILKNFVANRINALPHAQQGKAAQKCWSALKSSFKTAHYKDIPSQDFPAAVSLIARLPLEGELQPKEEASPQSEAPALLNFTIEDWKARNPEHFTKDLPNSPDLRVDYNTLLRARYSPGLDLLQQLANAGHCIDGPFYELRSYQNGFEQLDSAMYQLHLNISRALEQFEQHRRACQVYVSVK